MSYTTQIKGYVSWHSGTGLVSPTFLPFGFVPGGQNKGAGVTGHAVLGAGDLLQVFPLLLDPAAPLAVAYAELLVVSTDGTQALGIEADSGLTLNDAQYADWTGYSEFGRVGTDLSVQQDGDGVPRGIASTAGGVFLVSLALWQTN